MEFKTIVETVFIKDLDTHAYILEGGEIWIQLEPGKNYLKHTFMYSPLAEKYGKHYADKVVKVFDALNKRYEDKLKNKKY